MGVIRVKLANNYTTDQQNAANQYFQSNRTVKIITPNNIIAGTWELLNSVPYDRGFGAVAKKTDGAYWGFNVCFLRNQATGFTELYLKHLLNQEGDGTISTNYLAWWQAMNNQALVNLIADPNSMSISEAGTFMHPAYLAVSRLNEISMQNEMDIDFTYPSPIHPDQPNFYLNDTNINVPLTKRTMQTSQRVVGAQVPGTVPEENEGFGAYGDNPWPKCSMMSFFSVVAHSSSDKEDVEAEIKAAITDCWAEQDSEWTEQWDQIQEITPSPPSEAAAKSASIPSDAFDLLTNSDVNNLFEAWMKYQTDGSEWAADIQKGVDSEIGINGQLSFTEQDGKRYARVGGSFLNEPQAADAAKAIKKAIHSQGA